MDENNGLGSPPNPRPTMSIDGAMKNKDEKKIRFGGWNNIDYRFVRRKFKRFWTAEMEEDVGYDVKVSIQDCES